MSRSVTPKAEVIRQTKRDGKTVLFANLMDPCHLKNAELAKHLQEYKRQPVFRVDNVKDEGGYRAVFTEHGASASQTAAAKFLDTISKLLGMALPDCYECRKKNVLKCGSEFLHDKCQQVGIILKTPVVLLERNLCGHPLAGLVWVRKFEKVILEKGWEESTNLESVFTCTSSDFSHRCMWMI